MRPPEDGGGNRRRRKVTVDPFDAERKRRGDQKELHPDLPANSKDAVFRTEGYTVFPEKKQYRKPKPPTRA
jgi:hypothetical protein